MDRIEYQFLLRANNEYGLWAVHECSSYGCIADVLGVHPHKKEVYEFEFKRSSEDLKVAEKKKWKYTCEKMQRQWHPKYPKQGLTEFNFSRVMPKPHKFYYVMPLELWEKEKDYLKQDKYAGVIIWRPWERHPDLIEFVSVKNTKKRESNTQKYEVVLRDIAARATNVIVYDVLKQQFKEEPKA